MRQRPGFVSQDTSLLCQKKRKREREKEKKVYVRSEFQQENFVMYFDTFQHFYLDYMISDITSNLNYACPPGRLRIQENWPGWPLSTGVKFQPCDDWLLFAGLCTLLLPFFDIFPPLLVLYCITFWVPSDTRLFSFSLLFGEQNQPPMFLLQKLYENKLLNSMLNISTHRTTPHPCHLHDKHDFISQVRQNVGAGPLWALKWLRNHLIPYALKTLNLNLGSLKNY